MTHRPHTSAPTPPLDFNTLTLPVRTPRLVLRPYQSTDIDRIAQLANDERITSTTASLPYPYTREDARKFVEDIVPQGWSSGKGFNLVIAEPIAPSTNNSAGSNNNSFNNTDILVGTIGLTVDWHNRRAELGFWIGVEYWNKGYATEASRALIAFGFQSLGLERIFATHHAGNDASGRVQKNAGMQLEGVMRSHFRKDGQQIDSVLHAITRQDFFDTFNATESPNR